MNPNLDAILCNCYPLVFADRHKDMRTTALCWGLECGEGWYQLISNAASELEFLVEDYVKAHPEQRNPFPWFIMDSWYGLRWSMCYPLAAIRVLKEWFQVCLGLREAEPWWPRASQIKEKYGTLRFYLTSGTNEMYKVVDRAEKESETTCEVCGEAGKLRDEGWYYTRCNMCWEEEQK